MKAISKDEDALSMQEIQSVSFEILKSLRSLCHKLGLRYSLAFGTLIGAVRHKGYIPWDDDVDIVMSRPDFNKLCDYMTSNPQQYPYYKIWNRSKNAKYPYMMSRMIDTRYKLIVKNEEDCGMGIFVDIYVLDGAGNSLEEAQKLLSKTKKFPSSIYSATRKHFRWGRTEGIRRYLKPLFYWYTKIMGREYFENRLRQIIQKHPYADYDYVACIEWDNTTSSVIAKEDLENPIDMEFNGEFFSVMRNYDKYLRLAYGDYMTPPPEKDRIYHHLYRAYRK